MRNRIIWGLLCFVAIGFLIGCSKQKLPADMPKLYKFSVKILDNGSPLADAQVQLHPEDASLARWGLNGSTSQDGIVKFNTRGYAGVPLGKYKITIKKQTPPVAVTAAPASNEIPPEFDPNNRGMGDIVAKPNVQESLIDEDLSDPELSRFEVEVTKSQKEIPVFDIAKAFE